MTDRAKADFSDLLLEQADLRNAGATVGWRAAKVVGQSSQRIEADMRANAPRKRLPHYRGTITHDVTVEGGSIIGEIGPDADVNGQAKLASILEEGTSRTAPKPHIEPAGDREFPRFADDMERLGGDIL